jgi:hypothetical protein
MPDFGRLSQREITMKKTTTQSASPSSAEYQPRYPEGYWDGGEEYLRGCFILQHN